MAVYNVKFYDTDPVFLLPQNVGGTFAWTGPSAPTGEATITDEEPGIQGVTLDDDSRGRESATGDVTLGANSSTASNVDAEEVWTVRNTDTGEEFQVTTLQVENGAAAGFYTLSEVDLIPGQTYEVVDFNSNPDVLRDPNVFNFLDYADAHPDDPVIICFADGTQIATPFGPKNVADLDIGDLVITADNGIQPIRWIGKRTVAATGDLAPIRFSQGVIGNDRALMVSPQHRMLCSGYRAQLLFGQSEVLVPAKHMIDGDQITRAPGGQVTYFHLMFDRHEIIFAEGVRSESFHPGHCGLDGVLGRAREELFCIFPELRSDLSQFGPTSRHTIRKHEAAAMLN